MTAAHALVVSFVLVSLVACGSRPDRDPASRPNEDEAQAAPNATDRPELVRIEPGSDLDKLIDDTLARGEAREAATFPCSLFTAEEVGQIVGGQVEGGSHAFEHRITRALDDPTSERRWRANVCSWSSVEKNGPELDELAVSRPQHFDSGTVECPPPPAPGTSGVEPVDDLGDAAWWAFQPYGHGSLTVCSGQALVVVEVTVRGSDSATLMQIARRVAGRAFDPGSKR